MGFQVSCLNNIKSSEEGDHRLQFKEELFFHTELSEQLLIRLCEKKKMDDLVITLFHFI